MKKRTYKPRVMWAMNETAEAKIIQPSKLTVSFAVKKIADHTEPVAVIPLDNVEAIVERALAAFRKETPGAFSEAMRAALTAAGIPCKPKKIK